jgi:hypothetical protein
MYYRGRSKIFFCDSLNVDSSENSLMRILKQHGLKATIF